MTKLNQLKYEIETFYFDALKRSYLKKRCWRTVFLPFRNSYDFDCDLERCITTKFGNEIEYCKYDFFNEGGYLFHKSEKHDFDKMDLYDLKEKNELSSFILSNHNLDFVIIYGPFDYTCISGPSEFLKMCITRDMVEDYIREVKSYSSKDSREKNMQMIKAFNRSGQMLYANSVN